MEQGYVNPVNHGKLSATATTAAEAGKSGFGGWWKGALIGALLPIVLGAGIFAGVGLIAGAGLASLATVTAIGAGFGLLGSFATTGLGAGIGAIFGVAKGTSRGISRVGQEQGAANELQAQIEVAKAQAMGGNTNVYANDNKYGFPAQGSAMNAAASGVQLDGAQYDGRASGQQLAAARG